MNSVIWKYPLALTDSQTVDLPIGSEILSVQLQNDRQGLQLWVLVDPDQKTETRRFEIRGTGHKFDSTDLHHISTVIWGEFVWHVFERVQPA